MKGLLRRMNLVRRLRERVRFTRNRARGVVAVDINNTIGLGARLAWVLEILAYCEEHRLAPCFRFTYPGSDEEYFHRFFHINGSIADDCEVRFNRIFTIGELGLEKNYDRLLTIDRANQLVRKYLVIRKEIIEEVERFTADHFTSQTLGIHYRGTDKSMEAPVVFPEAVEKNIRFFLEKYPDTDSIFVASDDAGFVDFMHQGSLGNMVCSRKDAFRSTDGAAVHLSDRDKYDINRDALVNCLLLSRCRGLIKSASILSGWSVLFNPDILLIMLNHPYTGYFPERALRERVLWEPVQDIR